MSKLKAMIATNASTWVEYPDIEGFEVNIKYITREELLKIRSSSLTYKFNRRTRQKEEEVDSQKFIENYANKAILGWKGLKIKHLPMLLPVDISDSNAEEDVPYTEEDAVDLLQNSAVFDQFITDSLSDFEKFSQNKKETDSKN